MFFVSFDVFHIVYFNEFWSHFFFSNSCRPQLPPVYCMFYSFHTHSRTKSSLRCLRLFVTDVIESLQLSFFLSWILRYKSFFFLSKYLFLFYFPKIYILSTLLSGGRLNEMFFTISFKKFVFLLLRFTFLLRCVSFLLIVFTSKRTTGRIILYSTISRL